MGDMFNSWEEASTFLNILNSSGSGGSGSYHLDGGGTTDNGDNVDFAFWIIYYYDVVSSGPVAINLPTGIEDNIPNISIEHTLALRNKHTSVSMPPINVGTSSDTKWQNYPPAGSCFYRGMWMSTMANTWNLSTEFAAKNSVLGGGQTGFEIDTGHFKIGDGTSGWNALAYENGRSYGIDYLQLNYTLTNEGQTGAAGTSNPLIDMVPCAFYPFRFLLETNKNATIYYMLRDITEVSLGYGEGSEWVYVNDGVKTYDPENPPVITKNGLYCMLMWAEAGLEWWVAEPYYFKYELNFSFSFHEVNAPHRYYLENMGIDASELLTIGYNAYKHYISPTTVQAMSSIPGKVEIIPNYTEPSDSLSIYYSLDGVNLLPYTGSFDVGGSGVIQCYGVNKWGDISPVTEKQVFAWQVIMIQPTVVQTSYDQGFWWEGDVWEIPGGLGGYNTMMVCQPFGYSDGGSFLGWKLANGPGPELNFPNRQPVQLDGQLGTYPLICSRSLTYGSLWWGGSGQVGPIALFVTNI